MAGGLLSVAERSGAGDRLLAEADALLAELRIGPRQAVGLSSDLQRDLGLDSLAVVELFERVERAFGVALPEEVLARSTLGGWLDAIGAAPPAGVPGVATGASPGAVAALAGRPTGPGPSWPEQATTLTDALAWHAAAHPERLSVRILGGETADDLTYGGLHEAAVDAAASLLAEGVAPGERLAIMLPTGRAYFVVFLAALLAGAVPVPIYPPARRAGIEEHLRRQARLLEQAGARVLVTVPEATLAARLLQGQVRSMRTVRTPEDLAAGPGLDVAGPGLPRAGAGDLALVQYTSGSTGDPKGVMLTHEQILANIASMGRAAAVSTDDVFVSWLPLYHDMGLIGAFLAPLVFGFPLVVSSPLAFLARPASWLEAITASRATLSAAPNFAFQACAERVSDAELAGLELSSWRVAFNGSEPVSPRTLEAFAARFGPCGFRPEAMCPAYGLAEVGVGVAFSPLGRGPRVATISRSRLARSAVAQPCAPGGADARAVVSCGRPLPGYEIRVASPRGDELADGHEGAVSCRGPSATSGYLGNEIATRALWRHGWLETGDLGFIADGELFLTGRAKDLVVRAGRNLHPEELEGALEELEGVARRGVAVFSSPDERLGTERLVAVLETDLVDAEARAALLVAARRRTFDLLGTPPDEVVLAPRGALARTLTGKLRRAATREAFDAGALGAKPAPVSLQLAHLALQGARPTLDRLGRAAAGACYGAYAWTSTVALVVPAWLGVWLLPTPAARWRCVRGAGRTLRLLTATPLEITGPDPPAGTAVVVANHESFVDGLLLVLALRDPVVLVASSDLGRRRVVGGFLRRLGCAFVERGRVGAAPGAVEELAALVRGGARVALFPEGSITRVPGLRGFRLGAFAVATAAPCPVVPLGISGSRDILRPGSYRPRRGRVRLAFGAPLEPAGEGFAAQVALRDATRRAVAALSGEPDLLPPRGTPGARPAGAEAPRADAEV